MAQPALDAIRFDVSAYVFRFARGDSDITRCSGYVSNVPFADVRPELLGEAIGFELAFRHDYRP
jgi:hypothetical protein